jgi:hypothetical protein
MVLTTLALFFPFLLGATVLSAFFSAFSNIFFLAYVVTLRLNISLPTLDACTVSTA